MFLIIKHFSVPSLIYYFFIRFVFSIQLKDNKRSLFHDVGSEAQQSIPVHPRSQCLPLPVCFYSRPIITVIRHEHPPAENHISVMSLY